MIKITRKQVQALANAIYKELNDEIAERRRDYLSTYDASIHLEETKELLKKRSELRVELNTLNTKLETVLGINMHSNTDGAFDDIKLIQYIKEGAAKYKYPNSPWKITLEDDIDILSIEYDSIEDIKEVIRSKYLKDINE